MHIYIPSHTDHRHIQCTLMNTGSTYGLVLLPSLPGQDGSPLVRRSVGTCSRWIPPAAGLRHSGFPVAAQVSGCQPVDVQALEAAALPQLLVRRWLRHMRLARNPPGPTAEPSALTPRAAPWTFSPHGPQAPTCPPATPAWPWSGIVPSFIHLCPGRGVVPQEVCNGGSHEPQWVLCSSGLVEVGC